MVDLITILEYWWFFHNSN